MTVGRGNGVEEESATEEEEEGDGESDEEGGSTEVAGQGAGEPGYNCQWRSSLAFPAPPPDPFSIHCESDLTDEEVGGLEATVSQPLDYHESLVSHLPSNALNQ